MSADEEIRDAERAYRASGAETDGDAWVQAVMRTTGVPTTFLIARLIECRRALIALTEPMYSYQVNREGAIRLAGNDPVTPDDIVSFLRGGYEWLAPPPPATVFLHASGTVTANHVGMYSRQRHGSVRATLRVHYDRVDVCLWPECAAEATVHGELALEMYCEAHAEQVGARRLEQVLAEERPAIPPDSTRWALGYSPPQPIQPIGDQETHP